MRKKFRMELSEILELPMDISLDLPRVVIVGDLGVLISNHRGLIQYSPGRIVVGVGAGQITISGDNLEIEEVGKEQMAVRGIIKYVEMNTV
ncbi:MAG TPA: sporulation protein YqfC [Firmicutes bacterium]|nr:sporulation protein YqfC [Candidatus Fermentithermobacillaceae bacterium]